MKIAIVGGGTAGYTTALILKEYLGTQVDVIQSSKIGIIGVGEGSTEHFSEFMRFVGITPNEIIKECGATFKSGIMFDGWADTPYLHSVAHPLESKYASYSYVYSKQIAEQATYISPSYTWENRVEKRHLDNLEDSPFAQYHFDTHKLNNFLRKKVESYGISIFDDEISDVVVDESGTITELRGASSTYTYDFYIDCTGFKRLLIDKLGGKWSSFGKHLKMKAAVTFQTEDTDNYNLWTLAKTMNSGWMFTIPVWGRHGNGYIFDTDHTDMDGAKKELEILHKKPLDFGREFYFDTGALEKAWIGNCVAIGLSSIFVEPLEASSIGSSINQAFLLMQRLLGYTQSSIDSYNKSFSEMSTNIRDFIAMHYITKKDNTEFWRDVSATKLPDTLASNLEHWKNHLPNPEDFTGQSRFCLFTEAHYIIVMKGLELFNVGSIKKEYDALPDHVKMTATSITDNFLHLNQSLTGPHKDHLRVIRESF